MNILRRALLGASALIAFAQPALAEPQYNPAADTFTRAVNGVALTGDGDFSILQGSATRTVRVKRIAVSCSLTTASAGTLFALRRSTAASGGTLVAGSPAKMDQAGPSPSATSTAYSGPPTAGTIGGVMAIRRLVCGTPTTVGQDVLIDFGTNRDQSTVLRGVNEFLAVSMVGIAGYTGANFNVEVEWTEE